MRNNVRLGVQSVSFSVIAATEQLWDRNCQEKSLLCFAFSITRCQFIKLLAARVSVRCSCLQRLVKSFFPSFHTILVSPVDNILCILSYSFMTTFGLSVGRDGYPWFLPTFVVSFDVEFYSFLFHLPWVLTLWQGYINLNSIFFYSRYSCIGRRFWMENFLKCRNLY